MHSLIARNAGLPGGFAPLDPIWAFGSPQTPRRSSLIAHSFTSSYAPDIGLNVVLISNINLLIFNILMALSINTIIMLKQHIIHFSNRMASCCRVLYGIYLFSYFIQILLCATLTFLFFYIFLDFNMLKTFMSAIDCRWNKLFCN